MATGGFKDISTPSASRPRPRSMTMSDGGYDDELRDVEFTSVSALLEEEGDYFEDEHTPSEPERRGSRSLSVSSVGQMTGVKPLAISPKRHESPKKSILKTFKNLKTDRVKLLSRPRVVFRMFSLITSGAVLGASGHILFHYIDTRNIESPSTKKPLWNPDIRLTPTALLLGVSAYVFLVDLILSIVSIWPNGRYLKNRILASAVLLHSIISFVGGIIAIIFSTESRNPFNSMFWVCTVKSQDPRDLEIMDFTTHCSELRATWISACIYTVAHGLIIPTVVLTLFCGRTRRPKFQDAIIIEKEGNSSVFQKLGELKEKLLPKK